MSFLVEGFGIRPMALIKGLCGDPIWHPFRWVFQLPNHRKHLWALLILIFLSAVSGTKKKNVYQACFDVKVDGLSLNACPLLFIC